MVVCSRFVCFCFWNVIECDSVCYLYVRVQIRLKLKIFIARDFLIQFDDGN